MAVVIPATQAEAQYPVNVPDGSVYQYSAEGFSGVETVKLQIFVGNDYTDYIDSTGTTPALSSTWNSLQLVGPFVGRWYKGATTGYIQLEEFGSMKMN